MLSPHIAVLSPHIAVFSPPPVAGYLLEFENNTRAGLRRDQRARQLDARRQRAPDEYNVRGFPSSRGTLELVLLRRVDNLAHGHNWELELHHETAALEAGLVTLRGQVAASLQPSPYRVLPRKGKRAGRPGSTARIASWTHAATPYTAGEKTRYLPLTTR